MARRGSRHDVVDDGWAIEDPAQADAGTASNTQVGAQVGAQAQQSSAAPSYAAHRQVSPNIIRRPTFTGRRETEFEQAHATMIRERLASHTRMNMRAASPSHDAPHITTIDRQFGEAVLANPRLEMLSDGGGPQAAAYRILRHRLISLGSPQVIVVSSPVADDAKSPTAVNLSLALGEYRRARVLLVEADFSKPTLADLLGIKPTRCFAEQLLEHKDQSYLGWEVDVLSPNELHVMSLSEQSDSLRLDAPAFATAMRQMRMAGYDHVVVDAPPVLGSAEVNVVQDSADGVVLCTRRGKTHGRELRECAGQLLPGSILGMILHED